MKKQIGEKIVILEDFTIEGFLGGSSKQIKKGDEGFIDSEGLLHYTTGEAHGCIQKVTDVELEGYATDNIAKLIFEHISHRFGFKEFLEGYEIEDSQVIDEIEYILSEIL